MRLERFSFRSSGRDVTAVRRPASARPKTQKATAPKVSPAKDDATVTAKKPTSPKASPADADATVDPSTDG